MDVDDAASTACSSSSAASAAASSSSLILFPAGSKLPGLTADALALLRTKQRRLRASQASTLRSLSAGGSGGGSGGSGGSAASLPLLRAALSACLIFAQEEAGSTVCVHADGWVLTCAHCIGETLGERRANKTQWLLFSDGRAVQTLCTAWDPKRDLALLKIIAMERDTPSSNSSSGGSNGALPSSASAFAFPFPFLSLSPYAPVVSSPILCIGQPGGEDLEAEGAVAVRTNYALVHVSWGRFRGLVAGADPHRNEDIGALKHDAWTYWGHSGAPLIRTTDATLVGLHSSWDDETGMRHGVPHQAILAFLQTNLPAAVPAAVTSAVAVPSPTVPAAAASASSPHS